MKDIQKHITKYVNKKVITKGPTHHLRFTDCGTSTPHLCTQYLSTKVSWISRLEIYEKVMRKYPDYRPPAWAEGIIKLIHYHCTIIKFIRMASEGDIQKLSLLFKKHKLNFWSRVFEEYRTTLKK